MSSTQSYTEINKVFGSNTNTFTNYQKIIDHQRLSQENKEHTFCVRRCLFTKDEFVLIPELEKLRARDILHITVVGQHVKNTVQKIKSSVFQFLRIDVTEKRNPNFVQSKINETLAKVDALPNTHSAVDQLFQRYVATHPHVNKEGNGDHKPLLERVEDNVTQQLRNEIERLRDAKNKHKKDSRDNTLKLEAAHRTIELQEAYAKTLNEKHDQHHSKLLDIEAKLLHILHHHTETDSSHEGNALKQEKSTKLKKTDKLEHSDKKPPSEHKSKKTDDLTKSHHKHADSKSDLKPDLKKDDSVIKKIEHTAEDVINTIENKIGIHKHKSKTHVTTEGASQTEENPEHHRSAAHHPDATDPVEHEDKKSHHKKKKDTELTKIDS